jgi:aminodeoxyfutalosine deaminase
MPEPLLISADAILPFSPILPAVVRDGAVVVEGDRITAVGERSELRRRFNELPANRVHVPGVLLPGFINAHTHLELSVVGKSLHVYRQFPEWVGHLMESIPKEAGLLESFVRTGVRSGASQSLAAGVTTVGDISRHIQFSRDELGRCVRKNVIAAPRAVSYAEIVALGRMRDRLQGPLDAAIPVIQTQEQGSLLTPGLSPHAPYTVEGPALGAVVRRAIVKRCPVAMHLAEHREEADFLRDFSGPLGRDWPIMQPLLDDAIPTYGGGPIRWAQLHGLLISDRRNPPARAFPVVLAHVNYLDNTELSQLAASVVSVAYCPRTRQFFGHDEVTPHRYRDMLDAGINVCLATDSLGSNPDLSVLKEAQFVCERDRISGQLALEMITGRAADALGVAGGRLLAENWADMIAMPLAVDAGESADSICRRLIHECAPPRAMWLAGRRIL